MFIRKFFKTLLLFLLLLPFHEKAFAQYCSGGIFTTQAEIDAFPINNPVCIFVSGTLSISGNDIVNLDGLKHLKYVYNLEIKNNTSLTSLKGLDSITYVDHLFIENNSVLNSLNGLNSLEHTVYDLEIINNPALTNLNGLNSLQDAGDFHIENNQSLINLDGLNTMKFVSNLIVENNIVLTSLNGLNLLLDATYLNISNNPSLINLNGLNALTHTTDLKIEDNASLLSLDGLNSLTDGNNSISIKNNPSLTNITALSNLAVATNLYIENNPSLLSLNGLEGLTSLWYLTVINNSSLVDLQGLNNLTKIFNDIEISNNNHLASLNGLNALSSVDYTFSIHHNPLLMNMQGLEQLTTVKHFDIHDNQNLKDLVGLNSLIAVTFDFYIWNNPSLVNLNGLNALTTIQDMIIQNNSSLINLYGLNHLTDSRTISINNNGVLQNLTGLNNLNTIIGFSVTNNLLLRSLNGLDTLISMKGITAYNNSVLSCCFIVNSIIRHNPGIYTDIHNNDIGCNSVAEIALIGSTGTCCLPSSFTNIITICQGDSILVGNHIYKSNGTYLDTLQSVFGCDSITTTKLNVQSKSQSVNTAKICQGDSIVLDNHVYKTDGIYFDTIQNIFGCDSVIITRLTVNKHTDFINSETLCQGQSITVGNHVYNIQGTYFDTIINANGCDSFITTQLSYVDSFVVNKTDTICQGQKILIGNSSLNTTGFYRIGLFSSNGCDSIIYEQLMVHPLPVINASADSVLVLLNTKVQLTATPNNPTYQYNWNPVSNISNTSIYNPTAIVNNTTWFVARVTDNNNCSNSDSVLIRVINDCNSNYIYIPGGFSPNNDRINDCFGVLNANKLDAFKLEIFNRYGEKIFESADQDECWDGTYKDANALADTYVFIISFKCSNSKNISRKGIISLFR